MNVMHSIYKILSHFLITQDVDRLADKLPNLIGKFRVLDGKCNHFDFLWGIDSKVLIYDTVMKIMKDYEE